MQVKVFEAPDMASGLKMVRKELGPDALILSTRTVKNGRLGILGKQHLEITAAIDNQIESKDNDRNPDHPDHLSHKTYNKSKEIQNFTAETLISDNAKTDKSSGQPLNYVHNSKADPAAETELRREFDELKGLVKSLAGELSRIHTNEPAAAAPVANPIQSLEQKLFSSRSNAAVEDILLSQGINPETSRIISTFANEQLSDTERDNPESLFPFLHSTIADILPVEPPDFMDNSAQKRIALVGPTGVGKTTTLAKLAAKFISTVSKSVALITIDTYRIAAVEQLKVYGEIMNLPVEVVITPDQLTDSLAKHSDKELVLIDTAGRSHLDSHSINDLQTFLYPDLDINNHLVLSATTRDSELLEAIYQFSSLNIHRTIFTKIDECSNLGVLLNTQVKNGSPISFITNGQRVPEDILELDNKYLAQMIVPFSNGRLDDQ